MVNHPNRNWRRRWVTDLAAMTATHESGLMVKFTPDPDEPGAYDGEVVAGMPELSRDIREAEAQGQRLTRLMREAGDIMQRALERWT